MRYKGAFDVEILLTCVACIIITVIDGRWTVNQMLWITVSIPTVVVFGISIYLSWPKLASFNSFCPSALRIGIAAFASFVTFGTISSVVGQILEGFDVWLLAGAYGATLASCRVASIVILGAVKK